MVHLLYLWRLPCLVIYLSWKNLPLRFRPALLSFVLPTLHSRTLHRAVQGKRMTQTYSCPQNHRRGNLGRVWRCGLGEGLPLPSDASCDMGGGGIKGGWERIFISFPESARCCWSTREWRWQRALGTVPKLTWWKQHACNNMDFNS